MKNKSDFEISNFLSALKKCANLFATVKFCGQNEIKSRG